MSRKIIVEQRRIQSLKQHCRFARVLSEEQLEILARDMINGRSDPVEILSDGTIVFGHHFVQAARRLGLEQIEVVVLSKRAAADSIEFYQAP